MTKYLFSDPLNKEILKKKRILDFVLHSITAEV